MLPDRCNRGNSFHEPVRRIATNSNLLRSAIALVFALSFASSAIALEPTTPLANLNRQGWVMENGLPQNTVQALAQTADGFLWLGTEVGLVRFDGTSFVVFDQHSKPALPGSDVQCLLAAKDGSLWIGTSDGLAHYKDGKVTSFTTANGMPGNSVRDLRLPDYGDGVIAETDGGEFGVSGNDKVQSLIDLRLVSPDGSQSQPKKDIRLTDKDRASWTNRAVELWSDAHLRYEYKVSRELPGTRVQSVVADHQNSLWIGTNGGLVRYANGKLEKFPLTDPLASASILSILEDHEGNLWVGTESGGLQILRDQRFRHLGAFDGLSSDGTTAVVEDGNGKLWVGTSGGGLNVVRLRTRKPGESPVYTIPHVLLSDVILSLAVTRNGDVWVGTPDGLNRIRGSAISAYTSADGLPDDFIRSLLADSDGSLWVGTRRGLTHWKTPGSLADGEMDTYTKSNGLGSDLVGAMTRDKMGDLWIATFAGLSRLHAGQMHTFTTSDGLSSNVITSLLARENGALLVGTQDHGWDSWNGQRFMPVNHERLGNTTIRAILDDDAGHLWFATGTGLARCDCGGMAMMTECDHWLEFGTADGLRSRDTATNSHPSAWRAQDGHLWFATPKGLVEIDPAHFPVNSVPPPVSVERFAVDDADANFEPGTQPRIEAGHNHFQFDYAALSFVAPQKVRYRYMLEGFDHTWTEAGARRTAYYTNIPPGRYTFRVQAANNDGVWNTQGASFPFELRPHFYQTIWFYLLLALALIGLIVLALRLRLMRAQREFNVVLGERNRIAREIHDTLAQGYVGISVQLEVLSELLRHNKVDKAASHLDTVRGYVREGLDDARQSIWALRSQDSGENTLPVQMRRLVEQTHSGDLAAHFNLYGAYRALPPGTEREILRVAQEALHNVKKHAGATEVRVQLEYLPAEVSLEVRDDGRGFEAPGDGSIESPVGHYGLTGMRERAESIGATLEIGSEAGAGTSVRLRVPARGAKAHKEDSAGKEQA